MENEWARRSELKFFVNSVDNLSIELIECFLLFINAINTCINIYHETFPCNMRHSVVYLKGDSLFLMM